MRLIEHSWHVHHRRWFNSESPAANSARCAADRETYGVGTVLLLNFPVLEGKPPLPRLLELG